MNFISAMLERPGTELGWPVTSDVPHCDHVTFAHRSLCSEKDTYIFGFLYFERTALTRIKITRTQWETSDVTGRARLKSFLRWRGNEHLFSDKQI